MENSMYKRRRTTLPTLPMDPQSCDSGGRFTFVGQLP